MPDTTIGDFPHVDCADCGKKGCRMFHSGPLVPKGESGHFCAVCAQARKDDNEAGDEPKPIGYRKEGRDAMEGLLPSGECSDCGREGNFELLKGFTHVSVSGRFCPECKRDRIHTNMAGGDPEPLGYKKRKEEKSGGKAG